MDASTTQGDAALSDTGVGADGAHGDATPKGDSGSKADGSPGTDAGGCPPYQSLCNGICIPTSGDPNNCGGCGVACTGSLVCSAGTCAGSCLPPLVPCGNACVDPGTDNANCGGCGNTCATGTGCVAGSCQQAVPVGPPPSKCNGGGPPINVGDGGAQSCTGQIAQTTFTWALCSCTDVTTSSRFLTDAFNSTQGPYVQDAGPGGGVGLNGNFSASSQTDIGGTLWASAAGGLDSTSTTSVGQELHLGGPLQAAQMGVALDAIVNGDVNGNPLTVGKSLTIPTGANVSGSVVVQGTTVRVPPPIVVPPPCSCQPGQIIPVTSIVAAFQSNNDDAAIGLDPAVFAGGANGPTRLDLPCGSYYLTAITSTQSVAIVAHGHTALFVGGDVRPSSSLTITLDPTATLDVFIAGTIDSTAALSLGSPNYPALMRTYVGTTGALTFTSNTAIASNFYAAQADVTWTSDTDVYGGVYAGNFTGTSYVGIHYDQEVLQQGQSCPDAGAPPSQCGSCKDCGNQACIGGTCGACTSSAQCCAPLLCIQGSCLPG